MKSKLAYHIHRSKTTGKVIAKVAGSVLYNKNPEDNEVVCFVEKYTQTIQVVKVEEIEILPCFERTVRIGF